MKSGTNSRPPSTTDADVNVVAKEGSNPWAQTEGERESWDSGREGLGG